MIEGFYKLRAGRIIGYIAKEKLSFWVLLIYLIFEYLRPQNMYPVIDILPWGLVVLLFAAVCILVEGRVFKVKNVANIFLNIFFGIVLISSVFALSSEVSFSFSSIKIPIILILEYYLIINIIDTEEKLFVFVILFLLLGFKLSQFVFRSWVSSRFALDQSLTAAGQAWLENPGELAIQMGIWFAISIFFMKSLWRKSTVLKKFLLVVLPVTFFGSVLACGSRGSFLSLAFMMIMLFTGAKRKLLALLLIFLVFLSIPYVVREKDIERTLSAGTESDITAKNRLERWHKGLVMVEKHPLLGVGFKNWGIADKTMFDGTGDLSHNIFIECMSELGYSGLIAFILLIFFTVKNNFKTIRAARNEEMRFIANLARALNVSLVGYLVAGFFVTVLFYPYFWVNLAMTISLNNIAKKKLLNVQRQTDLS